MQMPEPGSGYESRFIAAPDGLKLHVRTYGPRAAPRLPVLCLPGLARTSADFDVLATHLSTDAARPRFVLALDSRGRGSSEYDRNPLNYTLATELADLLAVTTAVGIGPAVLVGTSRGGILAMLLASARPNAIAGAVLNDIGPVIDVPGLIRIKSYVGKLPEPKSFSDAADILHQLFGLQFPRLTGLDWEAFARRSFREHKGRLVPTYDVRIARTLEGINLERVLPSLWTEFEALARVPVMAIRGSNSDVLSAATVAAMRARRPDLNAIEVPDQGHAPLLVEDEIVSRIAAFITDCEASGRH